MYVSWTDVLINTHVTMASLRCVVAVATRAPNGLMFSLRSRHFQRANQRVVVITLPINSFTCNHHHYHYHHHHHHHHQQQQQQQHLILINKQLLLLGIQPVLKRWKNNRRDFTDCITGNRRNEYSIIACSYLLISLMTSKL